MHIRVTSLYPIKVVTVFTAQALALLSNCVHVFQPTDAVLMIQQWLMDELITMYPTSTIDPLKQMHFLGHYLISAELSLHELMTISPRVTITVGKAIQNYTFCVARNIDQQVLEERVRNRGGSGQPPEPVAGWRLTELCGVASRPVACPVTPPAH